MGKKTNKSKFDNKFKGVSHIDERQANVRNERQVKEKLAKLCFNFKDFDESQCPPGQILDDWQKEKRLSILVKKFIDISAYNIVEAQQLKFIKIYDKFPKNSHFSIPVHIQGDVRWGTVQRIGGQKPRLAGYFIGPVFYPVFLDKDHLFYPTNKK
jgi:hypothetical protein